MMPGRLLHRVAAKVLPADSCERILDPQIADLQYEFMRADGRLARVVVLVRGYAAFWIALVACVPGAVREFLATARPVETSPLLLQFCVLVAFWLSLGAAVSWVKTGAVSGTDMLSSLRASPVWAFLPAFAAVAFRSRPNVTAAAKVTFPAAISVAFTVIYYTSWGGFHLYAHMSYALILLVQVMRRKAIHPA